MIIGKTSDCLCPVTAILAYMVARGSAPGPLFIWEDKHFLTREAFVVAVQAALTEAGLVAKGNAGHSF